MEKLLEHARMVHLTLIAVCAAIIGFAAAGSPSHETFNAIQALERLKALKVELLATSIRQKLDQQLDKDGFTEALQELSTELGARIENRNFDFGEMDEAKELRTSLDGHLSGLQQYLAEPHPITVAKPDTRELFSILTSILPKFKKLLVENSDTFRLSFFTFSNRPEQGWHFWLFFPAREPRDRALGIDDSEQLPTPQISKVQLDDLSVRNWLQSQLLDEQPLRALQPFWPDIKDQGVDAALLSLQLLQSREDEKLELLGLKVQGRLARLTGATCCLVLALYLLIHVKQLQLRMKQGSKIQEDFPWFAVYKDRLSSLLMYTSVTVVPIFSVGLLLLRSERNSSFATWFSLGEFVCIVAVTVVLAIAVHSLRNASRVGGD